MYNDTILNDIVVFVSCNTIEYLKRIGTAEVKIDNIVIDLYIHFSDGSTALSSTLKSISLSKQIYRWTQKTPSGFPSLTKLLITTSGKDVCTHTLVAMIPLFVLFLKNLASMLLRKSLRLGKVNMLEPSPKIRYFLVTAFLQTQADC